MDQVRLSSSSCSTHYEPEWKRVTSLSVLLYQSVGPQLLALQPLGIGRGCEGVADSRCQEMKVGISSTFGYS